MIRSASISERAVATLHSNTPLMRYDAACRAVAEAKSIDEVKEFRNQADAMRAYAKQAKNKQLEIDAAEIRIRAERRIGELMAAQRDAGLLADGGDAMRARVSPQPEFITEQKITLAEAGIDKNLADRARKLASVPEEEFEDIVDDWRERVKGENERVTTKLVAASHRAENKRLKEAGVVVPEGKFGTIVIDPPWPMEKIEREVRPNQAAFDYPTMSEAELVEFGAKIAECTAPDCHMFMWTTQKFLPMALRLLDAWSFRYVLTMVWHKPGGFQPIGLPQYNCEFVIYARAGTPSFVDTKAFNCCFEAPRREHSRKPDEFYDVVRRVTGDGRIDIFSREPREGFAQLGNEVDKFGEAA